MRYNKGTPQRPAGPPGLRCGRGGGRIFLLLVTWVIETILRRKINPKYEGYIHAAGMILLLLFLAFITFKDIGKLIGG